MINTEISSFIFGCIWLRFIANLFTISCYWPVRFDLKDQTLRWALCVINRLTAKPSKELEGLFFLSVAYILLRLIEVKRSRRTRKRFTVTARIKDCLHLLFFCNFYCDFFSFWWKHRLRIHRCATRSISCLMWMAWVRHTHAHFWQVQMQDFIRN